MVAVAVPTLVIVQQDIINSIKAHLVVTDNRALAVAVAQADIMAVTHTAKVVEVAQVLL